MKSAKQDKNKSIDLFLSVLAMHAMSVSVMCFMSFFFLIVPPLHHLVPCAKQPLSSGNSF